MSENFPIYFLLYLIFLGTMHRYINLELGLTSRNKTRVLINKYLLSETDGCQLKDKILQNRFDITELISNYMSLLKKSFYEQDVELFLTLMNCEKIGSSFRYSAIADFLLDLKFSDKDFLNELKSSISFIRIISSGYIYYTQQSLRHNRSSDMLLNYATYRLILRLSFDESSHFSIRLMLDEGMNIFDLSRLMNLSHLFREDFLTIYLLKKVNTSDLSEGLSSLTAYESIIAECESGDWSIERKIRDQVDPRSILRLRLFDKAVMTCEVDVIKWSLSQKSFIEKYSDEIRKIIDSFLRENNLDEKGLSLEDKKNIEAINSLFISRKNKTWIELNFPYLKRDLFFYMKTRRDEKFKETLKLILNKKNSLTF